LLDAASATAVDGYCYGRVFAEYLQWFVANVCGGAVGSCQDKSFAAAMVATTQYGYAFVWR
jgi:hypothetical protein